MRVFIERTGERKEVKCDGLVRDLLKMLEVNPETVLIVRNGAVVTEEDKLDEGDEIKLLSVVSGG
ncbi:MAG: MoaD/ThiS family protein [Nanoarchaeota archaeon]